MAVLLALADLGAQSQQDLADRLDLDKSHMVGFVDHLDTGAGSCSGSAIRATAAATSSASPMTDCAWCRSCADWPAKRRTTSSRRWNRGSGPHCAPCWSALSRGSAARDSGCWRAVSAPKRLADAGGGSGQSAGPGLTALLAMAMALGALGVDLMLPAFGADPRRFGLAPDSTQVAALLNDYLVGLAAGQLVYGVAADRFGRRRVLLVWFGIYAVGVLSATLAPSLATLLVARFLWGTGAAGSRVVAVAVVRDSFKGERMVTAPCRWSWPCSSSSRCSRHGWAPWCCRSRRGAGCSASVSSRSRRCRCGRSCACRDPAPGGPAAAAVGSHHPGGAQGRDHPPDGRLRPGDGRALRRVHVLPRQLRADRPRHLRVGRRVPAAVRRHRDGDGRHDAHQREAGRPGRGPPASPTARCSCSSWRRSRSSRSRWPSAAGRRSRSTSSGSRRR